MRRSRYTNLVFAAAVGMVSLSGADASATGSGEEKTDNDTAENNAVAALPPGRTQFDIKPQDLSEALIEFGEQAGLSVMVHHDAVGGSTSGLRGVFTIPDAIHRLLEGTGLDYRTKGEAIIVSRPVARLERTPLLRRIGTAFAGALLATVGTGAAGGDAEPSTEESPDQEEVAGSEVPDEPEELVVIGTRLAKGDPSARVLVIDIEDIEAQGLMSAEEIVRSIPHSFSSINSYSNLDTLNLGDIDVDVGQLMAVGTATANLRGLGSANTLVLVNGKRIAAAAGREELFANIRHIPSSAIERVEVHLDGGSAIFGSEAIGGVINIVLRKDYVGMRLAGRTEISSTGADRRRISAHAGYGWGTGNATLSASLVESDPVSNWKAGWTTWDYSSRYGGNQEYNFLSAAGHARSGRVSTSPWGPFNLILPPGHDGRNAQPEDFVAVVPSDYIDLVAEDAGGFNEDSSVTLSMRQGIGRRLEVHAELFGTKSETRSRQTKFGFGSIRVPETNAFNNFGQTVYVQYTADTELELALIEPDALASMAELSRYLVGFRYEFADDVALTVDYSRSRTTGRSDQFMFAHYTQYRDSEGQGRNDRLAELRASDDPNVAVNFFGDGTGQNPTIAEFFTKWTGENGSSYVESLEGYATIDLIEVPAGTVGIVVGAERRREWVEIADLDGPSRYLGQIGVAAPTREFSSAFGELRTPIIAGSDIPGLRDLTFSFQVHLDRYESEGAKGLDDDFEPIIGKTAYRNVSTRLGLAWRLSDTVKVRMSRSEAFRPPVFTSLFSVINFSEFSDFVNDPLVDPPWVPAIMTQRANPDLEPERSTNSTVGVEWLPTTIPGLRVDAAWSEVDYVDRIVDSYQVQRLLPVEEFGNLPQFFRRDEDGTLLERFYTQVNIARRVNSAVEANVEYSFSTDWGTFQPGLAYYLVISMFDQAAPDSEEQDFVGESIGIDRYKVQGRLHWNRDPYTASLYLNYTPGYINNDFENFSYLSLPNEDVDSYLTVDLTATYEMENGVTFRFGGRNIFDRDFPFMLAAGFRPFDPKRVDLRKRVLFLEVAYEFGR